MRLLKNYIKQNLNIKGLLKIIGVIFVIGFFISNPTFAQDQTTGQDGLEYLNMTINTVLSLLSRLRIFLSSLAGKLMTNDRVYGSVMHLDIYLWKIWNIMKNFANFMLVALVLVEIGKKAFGKGEVVSKIFTKTLLAAVLIQASRFVMGAVIDISNVTVSAVGSFPRVFMQEDTEVLSGLQTFANNFQQTSYEVDFETNDVIKKVNNGAITPIEKDNLMQSILPSVDSVGGPLIFIGASIFRFNEYASSEGIDKATRKTISLSLALKLLVIFFYTVALMFLVVANIIRIGFLWIFIVLSPIIVLYIIFEKNGLKKGSKGLTQYFDIKSILSAIFKPTIFVAFISLMLIVLVLIRSFFVKTPEAEIGGVQLSTSANSSKLITEIGNVEVKGNIMKDSLSQGQSMFSDLFVFLLGIFLMWQLVKLAISGKGPIGDAMDKIGINHDLLKSTMSTLPVFGGFGIGSIRSSMTKNTQQVLDKAGITWNGKWDGASVTANLDREGADVLDKKIRKWTGEKEYRNDNTHGKLLEKTINDGGDFRSESRKLSGELEGGLSVGNSGWMEYFKKRLDKSNQNRSSFESMPLTSTKTEDIKKFFEGDKGKKNVKKFHDYMLSAGFKGFNGSNGPETYEDLQKISYGTKSE